MLDGTDPVKHTSTVTAGVDSAALREHFRSVHERELQRDGPYGSTSGRVKISIEEGRTDVKRRNEDADENENAYFPSNQCGADDAESEQPGREANGYIYDVDTRDPHPLLRRFFAKYDPIYGDIMKWALSFLLLLFLCIVVVGMLYSGIHYQDSGNTTNTDSTGAPGSSDNTTHDPDKCHTQFGSILGVHQGVFAYSNCNDHYISSENSVLTGMVTGDLYAGLRWQCVEYARRYWLLAGTPVHAAFGSVNGAADIWSLTSVTTIANATTPSTTLPLHRFASMSKKDYENARQNAASAAGSITNTVPRVGDILIYKRERPSFPFGHVAVIVAFEAAQEATPGAVPSVLVGEQNWDNEVWPSPYHNYSRRVNMTYDAKKEVYTLLDVEGTIYGWMRYG